MKFRRILMSAACAVGLWAAAVGTAGASTILLDESGFLEGQQSFTKSFDITGPGVLTVTMTNISWPEKLSNLNFLLSTAAGLLGPSMGEGSQEFEISSGRIYAQWFGQAQGPLNVGVYGMKIEFTPNAAAVPLPTSLALLLSGLGLLMWQRRQTLRQDKLDPQMILAV